MVSTPTAGLQPGTTITIASAETGAPVAGALLRLGGESLTTNASGQATVSNAAPVGQPVDITAPGFLDRQTMVRSATESRFSLWPRQGLVGFDENMTAELVYTRAAYCCPAQSGRLATGLLTRMHAGRTVSVGVPDSWRGRRPEATTQEALDDVNTAAGGLVVFVLAGGSTGDVTVSVNPTGTTADGRPAAAYFVASYEGYWIVGGEVVLTDLDYATLPDWPASWFGLLRRNVAHELGHCVGLQHTTTGAGLMTVADVGSLTWREWVGRGISPAETALLKLAYQRGPGTTFPDNDRSSLQASGHSSALVCVLPRH